MDTLRKPTAAKSSSISATEAPVFHLDVTQCWVYKAGNVGVESDTTGWLNSILQLSLQSWRCGCPSASGTATGRDLSSASYVGQPSGTWSRRLPGRRPVQGEKRLLQRALTPHLTTALGLSGCLSAAKPQPSPQLCVLNPGFSTRPQLCLQTCVSGWGAQAGATDCSSVFLCHTPVVTLASEAPFLSRRLLQLLPRGAVSVLLFLCFFCGPTQGYVEVFSFQVSEVFC